MCISRLFSIRVYSIQFDSINIPHYCRVRFYNVEKRIQPIYFNSFEIETACVLSYSMGLTR